MKPTFYAKVGKRLFDLGLSGLVLIVFAPMVALVAVLVRVKLGSPVLFRHTRPGFQGKPFTLLKFRSMTDAIDATGALLSDAERLTRFGRFLRSSSLDELPELLNVLKGEMSLVGPRPLMMHYLSHYTPRQMRRHDVRPGLTGWAQVNGRNALDWERKFEHDLWYCEHLSFSLDLKILLMTARQTIRREGINQPGHATVQYFAPLPVGQPSVQVAGPAATSLQKGQQ